MIKENLQAIRKSIKHWVLDIKRPLKKGNKILFLGYDDGIKVFEWSYGELNNNRVPCCVGDCELCKTHDDCNNCPLTKNGMCCGDDDSLYNNFYNNPNLNTATDMVRALVHIYWVELYYVKYGEKLRKEWRK